MAFISADDALALLRAAGHSAQRSPARGRCRTLCYLVGGQYVNLGRLRQLAAELSPAPAAPAEPVAAEPVAGPARLNATSEPAPVSLAALASDLGRALGLAGAGHLPTRPRPVLPGEAQPPAAPAPHGAAAPTLPSLRADAAAGRPVSLAALAAAVKAERSAPTGEGLAGLPWDPGTPAARAAAALQGERVGILWPIAQALRGEGVALPPTWEHGGPVLDGTVPLARALAALPLGAIATAAAALAALPPVTAAQDAALAACRTGAVPGRPYL